MKNPLVAIKQGIASLFKANTFSHVDDRGWYTLFDFKTGAWQQDLQINRDNVLSQSAVFSCVTLIASDIGKLRLSLKEMNQNGIWQPVAIPSFTPVLKKPNHYQTRQQFIEQWATSKLTWGNTYVLKQRDARNVVTALYILHPEHVKPLVADNGDVFYEIQEDDLSRVFGYKPAIPASEIIHDRFNCLFHPLVGLSPIFASGLAATQGLAIQKNSAKFFENMSRPSGILSAPAAISDETALRLKEHWEKNFTQDNIGKIAVLGDGLKYEAMAINPIDAQMVQQLQMSGEQVCSTYHVPAFMAGVGALPSYDNIENLTQAYYGQCLQSHLEAIEALLDEGLGLDKVTGKIIGVEFELDDLFRMDSLKRIEVLEKGVRSAIFSPNEARAKLNMMPVEGGQTPYLQQQNYSLEALAKRDATDDPFLQNNGNNRVADNSSDNNDSSDDSESDDDIQEMTMALLNSIKKGLSHEV